jgi:hypothetical protein
MNIALACKIHIMLMNFLNDKFFIDVISKMPISVGSGEAIRKPAKVASKYTLIESGIHLLIVRTNVSFESFCSSSLKLCVTKRNKMMSLIRTPIPAITPAKSKFCSLARISNIPVPAAEVNAKG